MNKKITSSALAALMIAGSTSFTAIASMANGTVVIGNKAYDLSYANDPQNIEEITNAIVAGGEVYVKDFEGNWINNTTGLKVEASLIPAVVYKGIDGKEVKFDAADKDAVAKELTVEVATGAKALVISLKEKVNMSSQATLAVEVKQDDTLIDFGTPVLSEDGLKITVPVKDGKTPLTDAKYDVKISGLIDLAGKEIVEVSTATVTKKSVASDIGITTTGLAPTTGQAISYKLTDNYGQVYTDATTIAKGKITAASAKVQATGLPIAVTIAGDNKTATFDATGLKKDVVVVVSVTYTAGSVSLTSTKELTVGEVAIASVIKDITISAQKDANAVAVDTTKDGFILGKVANFDLTANLLDQYGNPNNTDNVVTWATSDKSVLAFNLDATKTVLNNAAKVQTIKVVGQGTAVISAYLASGSKVDYLVTVTLAGVKSVAATNVSGAVNYEDKEVITGFTFTDLNDKNDTLKPLAKDVTFAFKSGDKLTAADMVITTVENTDGTFKGVKFNAKKSGAYTVTMSYAGKTADFTVTSATKTEFAKLQDIADFTAKAGAPESKLTVKASNKYDEELDVKLSDLELTWYAADGKLISSTDASAFVTVKYYKADGVATTTGTDIIKSIGVTYTGAVASSYTLKVGISGTIVADTAKVTTSVATLKTIQINKSVVASDKLVLGDDKSQYVDLTLKDNDGDALVNTTGINMFIKNTAGVDVNAFTSLVYKHVDKDGIATYNTELSGAVGVALKLDPSTSGLVDGTYSIFVDKGISTQEGYIKSNTVTVVVNKTRVLDTATTATNLVTSTLGTDSKMLIVPKDQYGDIIKINTADVTLKDGATTVKIATSNGVVEKVDKDGNLLGYEVTLTSIAKGTEILTLNVKFSDTVTKAINVTSTVKTSGDITSIKFGGDLDNNGILDAVLHDTVIGDTDTYNTITLNLSGYDTNGNVVTIKASDFTWDESALPNTIVFDEATGIFTVDTSKLLADKSNDATGTVKAYQAGKLLGTISVKLTDAEPTIASIDFNKTDKVKEVIVGDTLNLAAITLEATTNFGDVSSLVIKASDIANWNTSDASIATVTGSVVTVSGNAKVGDSVVITGSYQGKLLTFTVKAK
ncbi:bacterial Ig-like domain-containing protein [Clostridium sp. CS001]|uniref:bacterial Ig-like domain-containing protein n=1 Tax=Clostridium sp. CS001 TaxID=2880648 RepID=UPI001CF2485D|nr:bacterial Ig-like domain-containing protein [Clostridium sp. CS001]MCB2289507.1 bacterial Ig-like domain-containing protein [Clostridium sp. CS001]